MHTVGKALAFDAATPASLQLLAGGVGVTLPLSEEPPPHAASSDIRKNEETSFTIEVFWNMVTFRALGPVDDAYRANS
ncbi:hypothetical protein GCM10025771_36790 [Niveibacterium umoris]|uniref:hypothetical protein n=1 Tax=Niveibacterium umoris TaxID=1193620 RepID=UPI001A8D4F50|nr:hypothetical protein [Niveibacterium umoris]